LVDNRINSCQPFAGARCPHQTIMERVYLFPQIIDTKDLSKHHSICLSCEQYVEGRVHVIDSKDDRRSGRDRRSSKERRLAIDPRFMHVPEGLSAVGRERRRGERIIDLRSGEDRRSGQDRRQFWPRMEQPVENPIGP